MRGVLLGILFLFCLQIFAQCSDNIKTKCIPDLNTYTTLKTYKVSLAKRKNKKMPAPVARYSLMLSKGTRYRLVDVLMKKQQRKNDFFII